MTTETRGLSPLNRAYETARDAGKAELEQFLGHVNAVKVNRASLASEARILRTQAAATRDNQRWRLNAHRTGNLRREARSAHLAWGYLRGRAYHQMEPGRVELHSLHHRGMVHFIKVRADFTVDTDYWAVKPVDARRVAQKCRNWGLDTTEQQVVAWVRAIAPAGLDD